MEHLEYHVNLEKNAAEEKKKEEERKKLDYDDEKAEAEADIKKERLEMEEQGKSMPEMVDLFKNSFGKMTHMNIDLTEENDEDENEDDTDLDQLLENIRSNKNNSSAPPEASQESAPEVSRPANPVTSPVTSPNRNNATNSSPNTPARMGSDTEDDESAEDYEDIRNKRTLFVRNLPVGITYQEVIFFYILYI